ncbi:alpha-ketoglutarate-dependent taurine dioxygenase [Bradyrhizobium sp. F1.13.3]
MPLTDVVKRAARIGVEIRNINPSGDLASQTSAAINFLLLEHKVIFFRDQGHLDDAEQERFAACLGKLVPPPKLGSINETTGLDSARR